MNYRKDISGLRAVAVLLVLLFHGRIAAFPSGFVGVDVFFVISGFLITSIIQTQLQQGRFSLADFYVRRLWRIQVALLAMVFATLMLALMFYLPVDFKGYLRSAIDTVGFVSNRYFSHATTAYAATDSEVMPLLHTWSLSIEWQWYLILPLWLMLLHRFVSARQGRWLVAFATVAMTAVAMLIVHREGSSAYYFFTPRVFEFLFGACLALFSLAWSSVERPPIPATILTHTLGVLALLVVIALAMTPSVIANYPNAYAIAVCAASAGVIGFGGNERNWVSRALSWRVPDFLGDISYSLYLWHWPIFAAVRYLGITETVWVLLTCYALTLLLAYLSYRYIEEPYRKRHPGLFKSLLQLVFIPLLVLGALVGIADRMNYFPARFGGEMVHIDQQLARYTAPARQSCMQSSGPRMTDVSGCTLGDKASMRRALMIGDSYSNQDWNFIDVLARDASVSVAAVSTPSCLAFPHIAMDGWWKMNNRQYQPCVDHVRDDYARITSGHYNYVLIGENWLYYDPASMVNTAGDQRSLALGHARLEQAMRDGLDAIVRSGATPVILESPALMPDDFQVCFYRHLKRRTQADSDACPIHRSADGAMAWYEALFARLQASYPSLILIDPKDAQCDGDRCAGALDGVPLYRDVGHLNDYGSYRLGELYLQRKANPLKR